eukprot:TRINITY_DN8086_c0_g1_i1.p1 TRINITY_DN8086_c0_g1~~TRINITY_DN8086_c0_g1_i1.p1  ORF type:complete len:558 (+),score=80.82 TRINITY_DN8086_c0_g1_i1:48-1676(+)
MRTTLELEFISNCKSTYASSEAVSRQRIQKSQLVERKRILDNFNLTSVPFLIKMKYAESLPHRTSIEKEEFVERSILFNKNLNDLRALLQTGRMHDSEPGSRLIIEKKQRTGRRNLQVEQRKIHLTVKEGFYRTTLKKLASMQTQELLLREYLERRCISARDEFRVKFEVGKKPLYEDHRRRMLDMCARDRNRSPTDVENSYIYLWGIIAYFAAEVADSSGVVSVFFCGMTMSQYTIRNISDAALLTSFHSLNSLSYSLQACLFTVIGFFGWSYLSSCYVFRPIDGHTVDVYSAAGMLAAIMAARGIIVPMFLYFCNRKKNSSERVGWRQQLAVWFSGLIRGLVSFWLSHSVTMVSPEADGIVTTTFIVVVFTTIVCGCLAKTMFSCFGVPTCAEEAAAMRSVEGSPPILPPTGTEEYTELGASDVDMSEMHGNRRSTLCHFRCSARSVPSVITGRPRASPVTEYFMDLNPSKLQTAIKKFDSRVMQPLFGESTTSVPHYVAAADSSQMGMSTEQTSLLSFPRVPQQTVNPFSSEAARAGTG